MKFTKNVFQCIFLLFSAYIICSCNKDSIDILDTTCKIERVTDNKDNLLLENIINTAGLTTKSIYYNSKKYQIFEYENNRLIKFSQYFLDSDELQLTQTYKYLDSGKLSSITLSYGDEILNTIYIYDTQQELVKREVWSGGVNPVQTAYTNIQWDNNNIIKEESFIKYTGSEDFVPSRIREFKFDTYKNPDKNQPQAAIISNLNENNVVEFKSINYQSTIGIWDTTIYKYNFEYNSDNYPIKSIITTYKYNEISYSDTAKYMLFCQ